VLAQTHHIFWNPIEQIFTKLSRQSNLCNFLALPAAEKNRFLRFIAIVFPTLKESLDFRM